MAVYNQYTTLASCYDVLNDGAEYNSYIKFICHMFREEFGDIPGCGLLDLACGTGEMTLRLRSEGFSVLGIDISEDMLAVASAKTEDEGIFFTKQDMRSFCTSRRYEAAVCCYDSLNYLTSYKELRSAFQCVNSALCPGGIFIFDINTLYRYESIYGNNVFALDYGDVYCVWENNFRPKRRTCTFDLTIFAKCGDGIYKKMTESHRQKYHSPKTVEKLLSETGFEITHIKSDADIFPLRGEEKPERLIFVAKKQTRLQ